MSAQTEAPEVEMDNVTPSPRPAELADGTPAEARSIVEDEVAEATRLKASVAEAVKDMFKPTAWQPRIIVKFKIHCPSGQTALVKHLDTLDLVEHDLVEELRLLTRKLFPSNIDAVGNPIEAQEKAEDTIWGALKDPEKRRRFLDMTGKLMATASVDPEIVHDGVALVTVKDKKTGEMVKKTRFGYQLSSDKQIDAFGKPIAPLRERQVYSGYIDFADRMTFFQELNKPLELMQPFRAEQAAMLQDMARSEGDGGEAE